jgi:hypothetical protein
MDLWDVVKLMVRRWRVSAPLVLLTAVAVGWTAVSITPHHTAEGSVLLLPPSSERAFEPGQVRVQNPWSTDSVAGAVITLLRSSSLHDELAAEGYDATWEAGRDIQFFSMINITVTASTAEEAQATVERLTEVVTREVSDRQQGPDLNHDEVVTIVTLAAGENVSIVRGNQLRALVVVLFAGGLLTVGTTIGVDAFLRTRAARRDPRRTDRGSAPVTTTPDPHTNSAGRSLANSGAAPEDATVVMEKPPTDLDVENHAEAEKAVS